MSKTLTPFSKPDQERSANDVQALGSQSSYTSRHEERVSERDLQSNAREQANITLEGRILSGGSADVQEPSR
eukprot:28277-Amphidinium_carterae.2